MKKLFAALLALALALATLTVPALAEESELPIGPEGIDAPVEEVEIDLGGEMIAPEASSDDVPMSAESDDVPMEVLPAAYRTENFLGKTVAELNATSLTPVSPIADGIYSNGFINVAVNPYGLITHVAIVQPGPYAVFEVCPGIDFYSVHTYYTILGFVALYADGVTVVYGYQGATDLAIAVTVYDGIVTSVLCAYDVTKHDHTWQDVTEQRWVVDKEAWDETVVTKEAWTETVVDEPAWTEYVNDSICHWCGFLLRLEGHYESFDDVYEESMARYDAAADWYSSEEGKAYRNAHPDKCDAVNGELFGWYYLYVEAHDGWGSIPTSGILADHLPVAELERMYEDGWFNYKPEYCEGHCWSFGSIAIPFEHPAVTHTVEHPAETKTVHHDAEGHWETEVIGQTCTGCGATK